MIRERIYDDPDVGQVLLRKRSGIRRLNLRVSATKGVSVSAPILSSYSHAIQFFLKKKPWVIRTLERQRAVLDEAIRDGRAYPDMPEEEKARLVEQLRRQAREVLPARLRELASLHGFTYNKVYIKHNLSNWGSCSRKGNINLNLNLVRLPSRLSDYVMLHELCHLSHMDHGKAFHELLESICPSHEALQKELRTWKLI